jgi:hypothetical protein
MYLSSPCATCVDSVVDPMSIATSLSSLSIFGMLLEHRNRISSCIPPIPLLQPWLAQTTAIKTHPWPISSKLGAHRLLLPWITVIITIRPTIPLNRATCMEPIPIMHLATADTINRLHRCIISINTTTIPPHPSKAALANPLRETSSAVSLRPHSV